MSLPIRKFALVLLLPGLVCLLLLGGCLSRPALVKQSFVFSGPPITSETSGERQDHGRVLELRRLTVAAPFDGQPLVYRTGEFSYERDPYAEFLVPPEQALAGPVRAYLAASGDFSAVVEPGSAERPNTVVEVAVERLYGDFQNHSRPLAVLALRFTLFSAPNGLPGKILMQKTYPRRVPLGSRTAAGVVKGLNEALNQIMSQVNRDLNKP